MSVARYRDEMLRDLHAHRKTARTRAGRLSPEHKGYRIKKHTALIGPANISSSCLPSSTSKSDITNHRTLSMEPILNIRPDLRKPPPTLKRT